MNIEDLLVLFIELLSSSKSREVPTAVVEILYVLTYINVNKFTHECARLIELLNVLHSRFPGISNPLYQDRLGALLGCLINQYIGSGMVNPFTSRN